MNVMLESYIRSHLEQIAINTGRIADTLEILTQTLQNSRQEEIDNAARSAAKHERLHNEAIVRQRNHKEARLEYPPVSKEPTTLDELKEIQDAIDELKQSLIDEDLSNG